MYESETTHIVLLNMRTRESESGAKTEWIGNLVENVLNIFVHYLANKNLNCDDLNCSLIFFIYFFFTSKM